MAKSESQPPRVPDGPTVPSGNTVSPPSATSERIEPPSDPALDERRPGGRRPYADILAENEVLSGRVEELRDALTPFALIPVDYQKNPEQPQYVLTKGQKALTITGAQIVAAKTALGIAP